ncbi:MAG: hypothetical protein HRU03_04320 [Nanoarchaeales archaeon]|nr:hypothetical protein [Nanoarchaeales archaeon]
MNFKSNKLNGISLILFLLIGVFIVPMNIGYAAGPTVTELFKATPDSHGNTQNEIAATCGAPVNVKDSLIMSVVTLCIPGILEKVKEWKEISCEASVCKYNAVMNGVDPSFCDKQKEYKFCKFIWGDIFSVPPLAIIEMYKDMIKELIANPIGIYYSYVISNIRTTLTAACTGVTPNPSCKGSTVGIFATGLFINDIIGVYQTFEDMAKNGFNGGRVEQNFCEQARDIKVELVEIIDVYKKLQKMDGGQE